MRKKYLKCIKIICINFVVLLCVIVLCEFIVYFGIEKGNLAIGGGRNYISGINYSPLKLFKETIIKAEKEEVSNRIRFRYPSKIPEYIVDEQHRPVILYGCSFAYGEEIKENETFSYYLQKETKRLVINRGLSGYGIAQMLWLIENRLNYLKEVPDFQKPDTVIYLWHKDQINRLYTPMGYFDNAIILYKFDKNKNILKEVSELDIYWWHSYILRKLKYFISNKIIYGFGKHNNIYLTEYTKKIIILYFKQAKEALRKYFKGEDDIRFVIFAYDGENIIRQIDKELRKNGIEVVYLSELSDENFKDKKYLSDGYHPNREAWKKITPLFVEKFKL